MLSMAFAHFRREKIVTAFIILAVMTVVGSVTAAWAIKEAAIERPLDYLRNTGTDVWVMIPGVHDYGSFSLMTSPEVDKVRASDGITDAQGTMLLYATAEKGDMSNSVLVQSVEQGKSYGGAWQLSSGRQFERQGEVVLDETLARDLNIGLGEKLKLANKDFAVVGFASGVASAGKQMVFMSTTDAQTSFGGAPVVTHIQAKSSAPARSVAAIRQLGYSAYTTPDWVEANREYYYKQFAAPLDSLAQIAGLMGLMLLVLVMLTAGWLSRKQLAFSKARGASTASLGSLLLLRSYMAEAIGFVLAIPIAMYFISGANDGSKGLEANMTSPNLGLTVVIVLLATILALVPSLRSIHKVDPTIILEEA